MGAQRRCSSKSCAMWTLSTTCPRCVRLVHPDPGSSRRPDWWGCEVIGKLYDRALKGERCWVRHDDGVVAALPVHHWLGGSGGDEAFDNAVVRLCAGPTIELGCGPARLVADLIRLGIPALGVDQSKTAIKLARRNGAHALHGDVFQPLPGIGWWQTVILADGNVGLGGEPSRILHRAGELMRRGGRCLTEVDPAV